MQNDQNNSNRLINGIFKGGFRRVNAPQLVKKMCVHPEHQPPGHFYMEPGSTYEYTCPGCGFIHVISNPLIY